MDNWKNGWKEKRIDGEIDSWKDRNVGRLWINKYG